MKRLLLESLYIKFPKRFLSPIALLALFAGVLFAGVSCTNSLDPNTSENPINLGIIVVNGNPDFLFGNACDESGVEVITEAFPEGELLNVELKISGSNPNHPAALRGCIFDADTNLTDGQAFASYLAGIFIGSPDELASAVPPIRTINISATISTVDGVEDGDFGTIVLRAVGLIPPDAIEDLVTNPAGDPTSIFVTLPFQSVGLKAGTEVTFRINRADLGTLVGPGGSGTEVTDVISGSEEDGSVDVQYTTMNNTGGTQTVTATVILPNPFDFDLDCPNVPESQRTIRVNVVITQSVPEPSPPPAP